MSRVQRAERVGTDACKKPEVEKERKGRKRLKHHKQRGNMADGTESSQQAREGRNGLLHVIWKRQLFMALSYGLDSYNI